MEIDRLYSLSQFVDLQRIWLEESTGIKKPSDINADNVDDWNTKSIHAYGKINRYNNFLKQDIKKEMFVNDLEYPIDHDYLPYPEGTGKYPTECYLTDKEEFRQAEKKVIFETLEYDFIFIGYVEVEDHEFRIVEIDLNDYGTLEDLANEPDSNLKLKNVNI